MWARGFGGYMVELPGERRHRGGIDTAVAVDLPGIELLVGVERAREQIVVGTDERGRAGRRAQAVGAGLLRRSLPRDLGDVVVEADVSGRVVVLEELPLRQERVVQIGRGRVGPKGGRLGLVLELDHEDVLDRAGARAARVGWSRPPWSPGPSWAAAHAGAAAEAARSTVRARGPRSRLTGRHAMRGRAAGRDRRVSPM
jgi:hypothetical protein